MLIDCHNHIGVDPCFYANKSYPYACFETACREMACLNPLAHWGISENEL
jgi:hypothetical protein